MLKLASGVAINVGIFAALRSFAGRTPPCSRSGHLISAAGLVLFIIGWWIMTQALRANPFASPAVRHQEERHHVAVDRGL